MALTVDVVGPAPWGFRISGGRDFHMPITVTKVSASSRRSGGTPAPPKSGWTPPPAPHHPPAPHRHFFFAVKPEACSWDCWPWEGWGPIAVGMWWSPQEQASRVGREGELGQGQGLLLSPWSPTLNLLAAILGGCPNRSPALLAAFS